ncbi:DoxX family protein [Mycolicibacterium sp. Dal123E01]|uniref:DoxX family protein n=1 Tax=Mycolicibacterium sp. Dal123E01 TaxID=3457578 RepID=UPI00403E6E44
MPQQLTAKLDSYAPGVLSLFRVICALVLLTHATAHLFGWPTGHAASVGSWPLWYAGILEIVTGVLVALGFFTRAAAFVASGVMAFAYFSQHMPTSFWPIVNKGEPALLLSFGFLLLACTGGGSIALDRGRR